MDKDSSLYRFLYILCILELCGYAIFMTLNVIALKFARATMEHAGKSGVLLSVGAEMEDYGDQAAAASKHAACLGRSQAGNLVITNIEWYKWQARKSILQLLLSQGGVQSDSRWQWLHSYRKSSESNQKQQLQGVSIIKPLIGYDKNMKENVESFFHLDYPNFELLFCIAEERNMCVREFLKELMTKYPSIPVVVYQGGEKVGVNPKINNMLPGYRNAKHELIWISDHNIKTPAYTLTEMVGHMADPQVGLVHQLPYVDTVDSFPGYLDKETELFCTQRRKLQVYFGTQHARVYLLAAWAGDNCANGMSWLVRKRALEQEGGLQAFTEYLAEDFFMSKAIWIRGWKFVLSTIPSRQNPDKRSLSIFQARMVRWGRLRATMMPWPGLLEPVTESLCLGLLSGLSFYVIFDVHPLLFLLPHLIVWLCLDFLLFITVEHHKVISSPCYLLLAWILREVCTLPIFLMGLWSREVIWQDHKYQLQMGGKATKLY